MPSVIALVPPNIVRMSQQPSRPLCISAGCVSQHLTAHLINQRCGDHHIERRATSHRLIQMISSEGKALNISLRPVYVCVCVTSLIRGLEDGALLGVH